jgi:hypothetical protein
MMFKNTANTTGSLLDRTEKAFVAARSEVDKIAKQPFSEKQDSNLAFALQNLANVEEKLCALKETLGVPATPQSASVGESAVVNFAAGCRF